MTIDEDEFPVRKRGGGICLKRLAFAILIMVFCGMKMVSVILVLVGVVGLLSCQSSIRKVATPVPTEAHAEVSGKPLPTLKRGYGVYMKNCAQCHEHQLPNTVTLPEWHAKIDSMAHLAGLSKEDQKSLQIYLGEFSDR